VKQAVVEPAVVEQAVVEQAVVEPAVVEPAGRIWPVITARPAGRPPQHSENHEHDHAEHESSRRHDAAEPDHVRVGMFR
jgi:hypothetical protein